MKTFKLGDLVYYVPSGLIRKYENYKYIGIIIGNIATKYGSGSEIFTIKWLNTDTKGIALHNGKSLKLIKTIEK